MQSRHLLPVSIEPMRHADLDAVMAMDKLCFSSPWSADSYLTELRNRAAQYFVARTSEIIIGYGGAWVIDHEAHVTTLAVLPQYRRCRVGERLLIALLQECILRHAHRVSLEVRVGNTGARNLYARYGFVESERRAHYYLDNGDDALIMRVDNVHLAQYSQLHLDITPNMHREQ